MEIKMPTFIHIFHHENKGRCLKAVEPISKGTTIFEFYGSQRPISEVRNKNIALQINEGTMLESPSEENFDNFINHSCRANCSIQFQDSNLRLVAIRNIKAGEELSFNYNTTEFDLIDQGVHFECQCLSKKCIQQVRGFSYLTLEQKSKLKKHLSPFLKIKLDEEKKALKKKEEPIIYTVTFPLVLNR